MPKPQEGTSLVRKKFVFISVAEPKLFIFGSGFDFGHNFGSSYSHILLALITVLKHYYYTNRGSNDLFFILASSKLTAENVF